MIPDIDKQRLVSLHRAYQAFVQASPWTPLTDHHAVCFRHPAKPELVYCSTIGHATDEFGLSAFTGPYAKHDVLATHTGQSPIACLSHAIAGTAGHNTEVPADERQALRELGITYQNPKHWPTWLAIDHSKTTELPIDTLDQETFTAADAQVLTAAFTVAVAVVAGIKKGTLKLDANHPYDRITIIRSQQTGTGTWQHRTSVIIP